MANPTTNYGFVLPTPTDLVTDLPADFEVALQGVDTQMKTNADAAIAKSIVTTKGDIIVATGSGTVVRQGVGTDGQILSANSAQADGVEWITPAAGGGMTLISTTTMSGSSVSLTSIPSTYINLYLIISQVYGSSDGADFRIQFNTDTGANYGIQNGTTLQDGLTQIGMSSLMTTSTSPYKKLQGIIEIPRYALSDYKFVPIRLSASAASTDLYQVKQGLYASTNAISSIQLKPSAGTFSGGTVYLYGVK
jgi:hypothetical protein